MGYYVKLTESSFRIPQTNLDEAYKRMVELKDHDDLNEKWLSWMYPNYSDDCNTAAEIFEVLRFEIEVGCGELFITEFDSNLGREDLFLAAICDLAEPGSRLYWRGEEGKQWMVEYGGAKPINYKAKVEYVVVDS